MVTNVIKSYLDSAKPRAYPTPTQQRNRKIFLEFELRKKELSVELSGLRMRDLIDRRVNVENMRRGAQNAVQNEKSLGTNGYEIDMYHSNEVLNLVRNEIESRIQSHCISEGYASQESLNQAHIVNSKQQRYNNALLDAQKQKDADILHYQNSDFIYRQKNTDPSERDILSIAAKKNKNFADLRDELDAIGGVIDVDKIIVQETNDNV